MTQLLSQVLRDRYQIRSLLGRQTGRRTFLATDLINQTDVVLKLLLFGPDFTWEDLKLFEREAKTLKALDHAAIPKYFDAFEIETELGQGFAFVQSYIPARSLQDWAESNRYFSEAELKAIATQLLDILNYLHSRQPPVIHRDIKPSNILLGDRSGNHPGQVYLIDFGSVQTIQQSGTITVVGTYGYMPPEQFGGRTVAASDLFSLGTTLIYLLTRTHPADLPCRNGRLQFEAPQMSDRFQTWLHCMIHPDIERRFKSAELALKALGDEIIPLPNYCQRLTKPAGSQVILSKTDDYLEIIVPPFSAWKKLRLIGLVSATTLLSWTIPLLFSLWKIEALLLLSPVFLWLNISGCSRRFPQIFNQRKLLITQTDICLTQNSLGISKRHSSPGKDIIKIERFSYANYLKKYKKNQEFSNANTIVSTLKVWAGNQDYSIEDIGFSPYKKLTELELDWLAAELSEWLDLPPYTLDNSTEEIASGDHNNKTNQAVLNVNPIYSLDLPKIDRPKEARCTLNKYEHSIEVVAPENLSCQTWFLWIAAGVCLGPTSLAIIFRIVSLYPVTGLSLIAVAVGLLTLWWIGDSRVYPNNLRKIVFKADKKRVSSWRINRNKKLLSHADIKLVNSVQIVYFAGSSHHSNRYHVQLKIAEDPAIHAWYIVVGNRKFWLPRPEAYWLAYELSTWLKVPVTELEVIETSSP